MSLMERLSRRSPFVTARALIAAAILLGAAAGAGAAAAAAVTGTGPAVIDPAQLSAVAPPAGGVRPAGVRSGSAASPASASPVSAAAVSASTLSAAAVSASTVSAARELSAAGGCAEPACDVRYHGGPVQHRPRVYLIFWGPMWTKDPAQHAAESYLLAFYKGLGAAPDTWSPEAAQYSDGTGHPAFGRPLYAGMHVDTSSPPSTVTVGDLGKEADKAIGLFKLTDVDDAQVVIASEAGTCFATTPVGQFEGDCGVQQPLQSAASGYCAYHSFDYDSSVASLYLPWINLPYQLDAGTDCGMDFVRKTGTFDGFSMVAGQESIDTATDPLRSAWIDRADGVSGGEVAEKCAWGGATFGTTAPSGLVTLSTGKFAMQSLWSNATGRCVMTGRLALSIARLATQYGVLGAIVNLPVGVTSSGRTRLTFTAKGLPPGLSIDRYSGTITGNFGVTAGIFKPTITVSYYAGAVTAKFPWQVSSAPGRITGIYGKCADDFLGRANGKIDLWTCDGAARQRLTFTASGELQLLGRCVTAYKTALLKPCTGAASQQWRRLANGEYTVRSSGACLTDPRKAKANGTQLTLATCTDTTNQRWTLPH
jgi:serine protease